MFGSDILDIAVGLIFVYLLASLIVSAATELIAGYLGWRANKLWDGIQNLIDSPNSEVLAKELYAHPLIKGMSPLPTKIFALLGPLKPSSDGPSYIPPRAFSAALLSVIQTVAQAQKFTEQNPASANSGAVPSPAPGANNQGTGAAPSKSPQPDEKLHQLLDAFNELTLPVGWTARSTAKHPDFRQWPGWPWERSNDLQKWFVDCFVTFVHHFLGWLLTVVAVSLGAPFWFDVLSRFVSIRASGDPPKQQSKSKSGADSKKQGS